ncbi:MAG: glycoside hydrolase family 3 C-terminal domain-containing protein [Bacteroidales bacterium]|nr:glycoside hydrolase family 3 C-terminal domain-containing protein [Candidatus Hennigimonas equi]
MKNRMMTAAALALALLCSCSAPKGHSPYEAQIRKHLSHMTLEEKAGQLVQINIDVVCDRNTLELDPAKVDEVIGKYKVGSILNTMGICPTADWMSKIVKGLQEKSMETMGIPCVYGLDMIHGATYLDKGTFFPQEVNLAATFNPDHAANMGRILAYETRSMQVPWVFSPVMDLGRDPRWPRQWESWGEDPHVQTVMAEAETRAAQGDDFNAIGKENVAVSIKHYMGYGAPFTGKDRTPAYIPEYDLRERYFRPFKACIQAGALTIMVNSASINGIPVHANHTLLTEWVKDELDWDGMIVTDWADIDNLFIREHVAADRKEAIALGINAGIDMIMDPYRAETAADICELVREGRISKERLDDAVARVLRLKYRLGLFDEPVWDYEYPDVNCAEFEAQALAAAVESEVLLKNNGILPLAPDTRILVTGPNANSGRTLNGGWSYTWQGSNYPAYVGRFNTIYEALKQKFPATRFVPGVEYNEFGQWWEDNATGIRTAVEAARSCDVIVACIGENTYCETPGNLNDLNISANQSALVKALASTGKPVVLILNEGRPRVINALEPLASAIVDIMLPGNYGGDALASLLCGEKNFSGRLPFTYPKWVNSLHTYDYKVSEHRDVMGGAYNYDAVMDVQWPFGYGLSYTSFEYSDFTVTPAQFTVNDDITVSLTVRNTGAVAGQESVLVYSSDLVASMVPDVKRLRAFTKLSLEPGQSQTVTLTIPARELAFARDADTWLLEKGEFRISAGSGSTTSSAVITCTETASFGN